MVGRLRNDELHVFGTRSGQGLRRLISESNRASDLTLDFIWELKANSDHHPFYAENIPVLTLHTGLHEDYHRPSDDADKINLDGASVVSRLLFHTAHTLADQPDPVAFRTASRHESARDQKTFQQPATPRSPRLGVDWQQDEASGGLLVRSVHRGSAAARAGLQPGDRLLEIDGRAYSSVTRLRQQILAAPSPITLRLARREATAETVVPLEGKPLRWGFAWREDSAEPRSVMLCEVVPGSAAEQAGLQPGDRIYQVGTKDFLGSDAFLEELEGQQGPVRLLVERHGRLRETEITPPIAAMGSPGP
jgi:C-terminal processing protease CtpA/Prc